MDSKFNWHQSSFLARLWAELRLYVVPPPEANATGKLQKLEKCVYRLSHGARIRYFAVWHKLVKLGCKLSSLDYGVFTWYHDNPFVDLFQTCVDGFLSAGSDTFKTNVPDPLCKKFQVGKVLSKASIKQIRPNRLY